MGAKVPKPFIEVAGRSILNHTIDKFISIDGLRQVIVVASAQNVSVAKKMVTEYSRSNVLFSVVEGGKERQDSIHNALKYVEENVDLIMVHDSVRPFVGTDHIMECINSALETGAAVLGVPVRDTIKKVDSEGNVDSTPDRSALWQIQTPQIFRRRILIAAYEKAMNEGFVGTDDSSLVESAGFPVKVVKGDVSNFKVTYPIDLQVAEQIIGDEL